MKKLFLFSILLATFASNAMEPEKLKLAEPKKIIEELENALRNRENPLSQDKQFERVNAILQIMLEQKIKLPDDILSSAICWQADKQIFLRLIEAGANLNTSSNPSLLIQAALHANDPDIFFILIRHYDINAMDDDGRTPLMHAILNGRTNIARLLIALGADVNVVAKPNENGLRVRSTLFALSSAHLWENQNTDYKNAFQVAAMIDERIIKLGKRQAYVRVEPQMREWTEDHKEDAKISETELSSISALDPMSLDLIRVIVSYLIFSISPEAQKFLPKKG